MNRYERHNYKKQLEQAQAYIAEAEKLRVAPPNSANTWKTRDGRVMKISEMRDDHLMNAISYCVRNNYRSAKVGFLKIEARRRGLM